MSGVELSGAEMSGVELSGAEMSGLKCPLLVSKLDISTPAYTIEFTV